MTSSNLILPVSFDRESIGKPLSRAGIIPFTDGGGRLLVAANRGKVPNAVRNAANANLVCSETRIAFIIGNSDLSEIRVVYSWYYIASGTGVETLPYSTATLEVALEIGAQTIQFKFGGQLVGSLSNGLAELVSDPIYPSQFGLSKFPAKASYWLRSRLVVPLGQDHVRTSAGSSATGEGTRYSDGLYGSQLLATGAIGTPPNGTAVFAEIMPSAIVGRSIGTPDIAALIIGDSIADGTSESVTAGSGVNDSGFLSRGLYSVNGRTIPVSKMTSGGSAAYYFAAGYAKRAALFKYFTHAICNYGTNDNFSFSRTAAQVLADLKVIWGALKASGIRRVEQVGIIPRTTSTDSFATVVNQTPRGGFQTGGSFRDVLNASLLANVGADGLDAFRDISPTLADSVALDKWAAPGFTTDGTHPSSTAHAAAGAAVAGWAATWV